MRRQPGSDTMPLICVARQVRHFRPSSSSLGFDASVRRAVLSRDASKLGPGDAERCEGHDVLLVPKSFDLSYKQGPAQRT
jgi:hypothetical protein